MSMAAEYQIGARERGRIEADILQEGRYGPRSERELDVRVGALAQGAFDMTSGVVGTGEAVFTIATTLQGGVRPTSATVVGGFAPLCSLFAGMQPLETGIHLFRSSRAGVGRPEDVWGRRRGVSKVIIGLSVILGAFFKLFSRTLKVVGRVGAQMSPELVAFGVVSRYIGAGFSVILFTSLICFGVMSLMEGRGVRREVEALIAGSGSSEEALGKLRARLEAEPLFAKRLKRVTKGKVLKEIREGRLSAKSAKRLVEKTQGEIDPAADPAGAVLRHIFMKLDKRAKVNVAMIGLAAFSLALLAVGVVATAGTPLIVLTVLGIVATLLWFSVDAPAFIKALKSGECGRADKAVLLATTVMLVGLIVISAFVATGPVGWIVMGLLALVCVGLQLVALRRLRDQPATENAGDSVLEMAPAGVMGVV